MRDIISATLGADHFLKCSTYSIARNGEGLTPCLSISIPENLCKYWAYIDFKKPNGDTFKTPRIDVIEKKIVYNIHSAVLDADGKLEVQIIFQNENNEIWKSYVKEFAVRYSINATDDIPDKQDFITEAQKTLNEAMAIAESIEERANNGEFNGADGKDGANGKDAITDQIYSPESTNAQSGKAVAEAVEGKADKEQWEQIADTTIEENAVINLTADMEGNPFALKKFIVVLNKPAVEDSTTKGYPWVKAKTMNRTSFSPIVAVEGTVSYADNVKTAWRYEGEIKNCWQTTHRAGQNSSDNTTYAYGDYTAIYGVRTEFKKDSTPLTAFQFTWGYSGALPKGTRLEIWGVRA